MQKRDYYPTVADYIDMGLKPNQIEELIKCEGIKHGFRNQYHLYTDFSKPHSIFFLDIKDTLYHSRGHGGKGVLGRSFDSIEPSMRDIASLVRLLRDTEGQSLEMDYSLDEVNNSKIKFAFPQDINTAKYKMDIPTKDERQLAMGFTFKCTNSGPFKVVFISSDDIQTQKEIILFLLLIEKIWAKELINIYCGAKRQFIDSQAIIELEELFETSGRNPITFMSNLPEKYKNLFPYDGIIIDTINEIQEIMNRITFLSTADTKLSKVDLMKDFLKRYNFENGLCYDDYNIFACGDDYKNDGPMIILAHLLGGYGCLNFYGSQCDYNLGELLRRDLYNDFNFLTSLPMCSYGFTDFYNKAMDRLSLQRTWDLAETMQDINRGEKPVALRFRKTNHYIEIVNDK